MNWPVIERIYRADRTRISRFHTANGSLIISFDMLLSTVSTLNRILLNKYSALPWIPYKAIRRLQSLVMGKRLLELGSGTSTAWYAYHCESVISFENNEEWFNSVSKKINNLKNIRYLYADNDEIMVTIPIEIIKNIDVFVVDCQPKRGSRFCNSDEFRLECLRNIAKYARSDAIYVIDNTDSMKLLSDEVNKIFVGRNIEKVQGWVPGIMHPNETTIVI